MLMTIIQSNFLRFFIDNIEADEWGDIAFSWVIAALVVAVLCAGLTFGLKAFMKMIASHQDKKVWKRGKTWLSFFIGLFPVFIVLWILWYMSRDFVNFIQVGGLLKGVIFAWLLYLLIMIVGHLVSPWRRELI